ncbi:hypothetical protein SAMN05421811_10892 [Nonomuraea wenchangensis]|uniref:Uncharacterized protein n=1 Tax=Nonomuraea wenchangensis TaxID=568860 RepID=A0A1I0KIL9_9ACTN|nr:hypothetical protein SAMN05421811_10892 [Nonomuraea wenchangensis]
MCHTPDCKHAAAPVEAPETDLATEPVEPKENPVPQSI